MKQKVNCIFYGQQIIPKSWSCVRCGEEFEDRPAKVEMLCPICGSGTKRREFEKEETCTILMLCKNPDRCPFKIEAETELKHKITEEDWRDGE